MVTKALLEDRRGITVNPYPCARRQNETEMFLSLSLFVVSKFVYDDIRLKPNTNFLI